MASLPPASRARVRSAAALILLLALSAAGCTRPTAASGPALFADKCASCHRTDGRSGGPGPDLSSIGTRYGAADIARKIRNPEAWRVPGYPRLMPTTFSTVLKPQEIDAIAAWLATLKGPR
jgi:mono/diheme cytochrome c family protein